MKNADDEIKEYISKKRDILKKKYNRVLPSNELLYDRYEKAKYLGFGTNTSIYDTSLVFGDVKVGKNVWIGPYTILDGHHAKLIIGDYVSINSGVQIYTHDTTDNYISGGIEKIKKSAVEIGANTVIGSMSIITQGVKIGKRCVVWANSLVTRDVPDNSIAAGNPAKIIGEIKIKDGKVKKIYFNSEKA